MEQLNQFSREKGEKRLGAQAVPVTIVALGTLRLRETMVDLCFLLASVGMELSLGLRILNFSTLDGGETGYSLLKLSRELSWCVRTGQNIVSGTPEWYTHNV